MPQKLHAVKTTDPLCPFCDTYHDGLYLHCEECLADLRKLLDTREAGVIATVTDWLSESLTPDK